MNWLDLYLPQRCDDNVIVSAIARAFDLPVENVHVAQENSDNSQLAWNTPGTRAVITRENITRDGDFPFGLTVLLKNPAWQETQLLPIAQNISQYLDMPLVTNVDVPDFPAELWRLVSPDGWSDVVELDEDDLDEGRMTLAPASRRLLRDHLTPSQTATLRQAG